MKNRRTEAIGNGRDRLTRSVCPKGEVTGRWPNQFAEKGGGGLPKGMMRMRSMSRGRRERPNRSEAEIARLFSFCPISGKQSNPVSVGLARRVVWRGRQIVKITEDVRKYAAEQAIAEEEVLKRGIEEKSAEFAEKGAEVYAKA